MMLFVRTAFFTDFGECPPLGLGYLIAALRSEGFEAELLDLASLDASARSCLIAAALADKRTSVVGMTLYDFTSAAVLAVADEVKRVRPDVMVILGGPQATFAAGSILRQCPNVDVVVCGEGEDAIVEIAHCLDSEQSIGGVRGIWHRCDGNVVCTAPRATRRPDVSAQDVLDRYPSPFLAGVFDMSHYPSAELSLSRGCPHACMFCSCSAFSGRSVRYHSVERGLAEVAYLLHQGVTDIGFTDDSFSGARERCKRLFQELVRRGLRGQFAFSARIDQVDADLLRLFQEAGVKRVHFGIESGDPEILRQVHKPIDLEKAAENVRLAKECGIPIVICSFIIGHPFETWQSAMRTLEYAESLPCDMVAVSRMFAPAGTELFARRVELGITVREGHGEHLVEDVPNLSNEQIEQLLAEARRRLSGTREEHVHNNNVADAWAKTLTGDSLAVKHSTTQRLLHRFAATATPVRKFRH
jgi:anaerobic magnesium-protoporphyrin IX monomethyl ester cyclase